MKKPFNSVTLTDLKALFWHFDEMFNIIGIMALLIWYWPSALFYCFLLVVRFLIIYQILNSQITVRHIPGSNYPNFSAIVYSYMKFYLTKANRSVTVEMNFFLSGFENFVRLNVEPRDRRKVYGYRTDLDLDGNKSNNQEIIAGYASPDSHAYPTMVKNKVPNNIPVVMCVVLREGNLIDYMYNTGFAYQNVYGKGFTYFVKLLDKKTVKNVWNVKKLHPAFPWAGGDKLNNTFIQYKMRVIEEK